MLKAQSEKESELEKAKEEFEAKKKRENELFHQLLEKHSKEAEIAIEKRLKTKLEEDNQDRLKAMQRTACLLYPRRAYACKNRETG